MQELQQEQAQWQQEEEREKRKMREKKKECVVLDEGQLDRFTALKFSQAHLTINTTLSNMRSTKTAVEREEMVNEFKHITQLAKVKGVWTDQNPALQKWALNLAH